MTKTSTLAPRAPRSDGAATKIHILETAGQVFAEHGYAHATSKEICSRAGTNMAAVNYHFGSKDGLYEAVLVEAHGQFLTLGTLLEIAEGERDPREKLRGLITQLVGLANRRSMPWGVRVILRELFTPSALVPALVNQAVRPKSRVLLGLVSEIIGLPIEHPAVQRGAFFMLFPCVGLVIAPKDVTTKVLPALGKDSEGLVDDLVHYVLAGLDAIGREHRHPPATAAKRAARAARPRKA